MQIAFIEDSDEDFALLARVFKGHGEIRRWSDAETALQAFRDGETDLHELDTLVVDLHLPGMDGIELIASARALPGGDAPTVCVLSSSQTPVDVGRATTAGADGYLLKPDDVGGLRELPARLAEIAKRR